MSKNFRSYLLDLWNTSAPFKGVCKARTDNLLGGYETAHYGTGVFGQREHLHYQDAPSEPATVVKAQSGSSPRHQSAAKALSLLKFPQPSRWHTSSPSPVRVNVPSTSLSCRASRTTPTRGECSVMVQKDSCCWRSRRDCVVLPGSPASHWLCRSCLEQGKLRACPELSELRPWGSPSRAFLPPVSKHHSRLCFPLVPIFSGVGFRYFS